MNGDQFTPEEQALIDRLRDAPQPRLSARTMEAIRQKMLVELENPAPPTPQVDGGGAIFTAASVALGLAAAVTLIVVAGIVLTRDMQVGTTLETPIPNTQVAIESSATPSPTAVPTDTPTPVITAPPTEEPTASLVTVTQAFTDTPPPTDVDPIVVLPSPTPVSDEEPIIIIEGPVQSIDEDTITVFDIKIAIDPDHPILNIITVGDTLRIEGTVNDEDVLVATIIDNIAGETTDDATVGLDGLVEAIEENIVTINNIDVELDSEDPILETLRVGDFLNVEGNFELRENRYLLVVVNIERVAQTGTAIPQGCYFEELGMSGMGRWRCDEGMGMGMGMSGMEGMGMGN
jgi:hypothetical protein